MVTGPMPKKPNATRPKANTGSATINAPRPMVYEVLFDQTHRNANLDILIDITRYGLSDVLTETNPVLLAHLQQRFGADKAAIVIPKTYVAMIRYMAEAGWKQEGILRVEYPPARGGQRIDGLQFGKILKL